VAPFHPIRAERDACGIGFVADTRGRASRWILDAALEGLANVRHRGAVAADRRTGDGAGVLLPMPRALVPGPWCGLAQVFLRDDAARAAIEDACAAEGIETAGWRTVPVEPPALGDAARESMPAVAQLVLLRPYGLSADEAELRAFRARRRAGHVAGAYVASLSFRTVTYKALCAADQLAAFYPDLRDPALEVPFAIFHQRFSTNTSPSWERAQPFRVLCHNGEINTIEGNVRAMRGRAASLGLDGPALEEDGSDSSLLDNALELLVRSGRDVRHAAAMLLPRAWQNDRELDEEAVAFHRYHAGLLEPWDGPAAVVFTDGRVVGAALDRNGLRPLRVATAGSVVACASEAGAVPLPRSGTVRRERVGPGELFAVDPSVGAERDGELLSRLARRRPYGRWLRDGRERHAPGEPVPPPASDLTPRQLAAGWTREDLTLLLRSSAVEAHEPVSSMGDDTALPPLAGRARPLFSYLRQRFAQVTNPAIDHLRERSLMSLQTLLGPRAPLFDEGGRAAQLLELESFFLFPTALDGLGGTIVSTGLHDGEPLRAACERIAAEAAASVDAGAGVLVLDDADAAVAVPILLALGAVHQRLVELGRRACVSLVVASDEPRDSHHAACLLGLGADAVCPRLALETVAALAAADRLGGDRPSPAEAQRRYREAVEDGVLKVMAKMGIADVASYRGAQLFDALGLAQDVVDLCFTGVASVLGGIGFDELERELRGRRSGAKLETPGYVKYRPGGEPHATTPEVVESLQAAAHALRRSVRSGAADEYRRFAALVDEREPLEPRDLLELVPAARPLPIDEVEPVEAILRRFSSGGMSHGSLSAEAHETVAIAFNRLGARSNCGEGGEDPARFRDGRNSRIKQVASGRFGVTPEYAAFADELQIKIAQGSKPGEGGQLPAHKVTAEIARLRHTRPGVGLISPPPHHDIYSIEDLAQLVFDLRQVNPRADVSVKLVAEAGVGLVAAGVVKALADVVHVAGSDGGTGASPLTSIKNAGVPWELGLVETQQTLVGQGLRGRVRLRVDGGLKTGRDVVVAALLGADEVSFGTALLIAEGCLMVRSCHLDTCPVGIATQRPELRAKFAATPEHVESYLLQLADDVRRHLAALGFRTFAEAVGRVDRLRIRAGLGERASSLELAPLLADAGDGPLRYADEAPLGAPGGELGLELARAAAGILDGPMLLELEREVTSRDRAVGSRLAGMIAAGYGSGAPPGRVRVELRGAAGQSFGAFLSRGVRLILDGEANDGVGKGMAGGRIVVRPPEDDAGEPVLLGNAALYGATGGELLCAGAAGDRFAVRNSGAVAVVEGVGAHACEYMTDGTVVVLGETGRNLAAGMSGGELFVHDPAGLVPLRLNGEHVAAHEPGSAAAERLRLQLARHVKYTGSERAAALLERWPAAAPEFVHVVPRAHAADAEEPAEAAGSR
jgi:glutamate synthase (ferredoxin)